MASLAPHLQKLGDGASPTVSLLTSALSYPYGEQNPSATARTLFTALIGLAYTDLIK